MKNNRRIKITAFMLVLCMMISILPGNLLALTDDSSASAETESAVTPTTEEKSLADEILEPIIVSEDITKRGEHEKHFLCDDGSYIAVSYPQAVHEQVDGEWVDIEYDVTADGNGISPVDDTIKVKFANNTNSAKLVKLESGDYKISWTVEAENENGDATEKVKLSKDSKATVKTTKEITQENKEKIKNEAKYTKEEVKSLKKQTKEKIKKLELAKTANIEQNADVVSTNVIIEDHNREQIQSISSAQSNVEYVGAFGEGTTLRYIMSSGKINEEIVLESYNGFKSYSMVIDTDGLTPVKTENGRVNLTDENGVAVVTIAAPYMYDAVEEDSYDIDVTVTQESKKEWRITYTPDSEWLTDKDRVYPVVIDPAVTTVNNVCDSIIDAYVYTGQSTPSDFGEETLKVGYDEYNKKHISYIRLISLPYKPDDAKLTGAGLVMKFTEDTFFYQDIGIYSSGDIYSGMNLKASNRPAIGEYYDNQGSIPENYWITFCSKSFGSRINNAYKNGVSTLTYALQFTEEESGITELYSSDATNVSDRPYFTIRYTTEFYNVPEGKYYIRNVKSGLYLNVRNDATTSGSEVTQKGYSGELPQIWEIRKAGTDSFYIIPQNAPNLKLYAPDSGSVTVSSADYIRNQWRFSRIEGATFNISTVNQPWVVLDVGGQSMNEDATIYPFAYHGYTNQQWVLDKLETEYDNMTINVGDEYDLDNIGIHYSLLVSWDIISGANNVVYDSSTKSFIGKSSGVTVFQAILKNGTIFQLEVLIKIDSYTSALLNEFGFSLEITRLIKSIYNKIDRTYPSDSAMLKAWKCSRLLGGMVYGSNGWFDEFEWDDVAGSVFSSDEETYFVDELAYTPNQYLQLKNAITLQHKDTTTSDFAHMQISLAARLAYQLDKHSVASNIFTVSSDLKVSYLAGWLGDATILSNGTTVFGNDDYCSDLDAENIYRYIVSGMGSIDALNMYFSEISSNTNRAEIFLGYIDYSYVQNEVFYELIDKDLTNLMNLALGQGDIIRVNYYRNLLNDEEYHWNTIKENYPDTYDFLKSLEACLANIAHYQ